MGGKMTQYRISQHQKNGKGQMLSVWLHEKEHRIKWELQRSSSWPPQPRPMG
jgi:hypothetical protein